MSYVIAVAGKGGTGKTTLAALLVRVLKEKKSGSVLAIDADPNSNLAEALGVEVKETIGDILDEVAASLDKIPSGMSKDRFIEYKAQGAVLEADGFDLLTMGRPEGPGCYCYVNNILRNIAAKLIKDYEYIVVDNEAGLEHLSRRTTRAADVLLVISDATAVGLKAAKRIRDLAQELKIKTGKNCLLINRNNKIDSQKLKGLNLDYAGSVPDDPKISRISLEGGSLMSLEPDADSLAALRKIGEYLWRKN